MSVIAVTNQKGGVSETSTTVNLAGALAKNEKHVLIVGMDPQGAVSTAFGYAPDLLSPKLYEVFFGSAKVEEAIHMPQQVPSIDILPPNLSMAEGEVSLISEMGREYFLKRALKDVENKYNYVLVDCPPSLSVLSTNALVASDYVLISVALNLLSLRGMENLLEHIVKVKGIYYIDFPYPILSEKKQEAEDYFNNEVRMNDVDDRLFRAFLYEFQRNIEEGKPFYKIDDPLYLGRRIFRDFYARIGEKPPYFISNEPIGDYYKKGAKKWRAFYKMHKDDPNIIRHQDGLLFIDLVKAYGGNKGSDLEQRLPPYVIESKDNPLILYEDRFLEFISSENRRESPFERMKRIWTRKG